MHVLALLALLLLAVPVQAAWYSEGEKTAPTAGTILADTGETTVGVVDYHFLCTGTALAAVELQHRNTTNTATLNAQTFKIPANDVYDAIIFLRIAQDERFRLVMDSTLALGKIQCSIFDPY